MPEIAEVFRAAHHLRLRLLNRTISHVQLRDNYSSTTSPTASEDNDAKIFLTEKTGLTAKIFAERLQGRKVVKVGTQGKYFYVGFSGDLNWVGHFSMGGWIKYKAEAKAGKGKDAKEEDDEEEEEEPLQVEKGDWPPKFWKFIFHTTDNPAVQAAFTDRRRFSMNRLVDCPVDEIRKHPPLNENGPDPNVDRDQVTLEYFEGKCRARKVPIKALLLDQKFLSGIGNWVADEILFAARVHPEQYSHTLSDDQIKAVHTSTLHVVKTACEVMADSSRFPDSWLMMHRWKKGRTTESRLPSGERIQHITVGGRTSAVVPTVQKKTGPVAGDIEADRDAEKEGPGERRVKGARKRKVTEVDEGAADEEVASRDQAKGSTKTGKTRKMAKGESPASARRSSRKK